MPQAENVVSFPVEAGTTDFLRDFIGTPRERLEEVTYRLAGLEGILILLRRADGLSAEVSAMLGGLEDLVHGCLAICELSPVDSGS